MLVHTVFFWLKKSAPPGAADQLAADCLKYLKTSTVAHLWAGPPAKTPQRDVVDATYDVGLTVVFKSVADHDAYQEHPDHKTFIERNKAHWQRVVVYDVQ
jgi:hypothetical protein